MTKVEVPANPNQGTASFESFQEMANAYDRILFHSPTLPAVGSPYMQEAYEALAARGLSPDTLVRFSEAQGAIMDGRVFDMAESAFYDEQSGIEVGDRSRNRGYSGGNRLHGNIRMRAIPQEGETKLGATKAWVAEMFGQEAVDALQAEYAQLKEWGDRIGEAGLDILKDSGTGALKITVGFADLTSYGDDTGIRGETYSLTAEQTRRVGDIFGRQLGKMKRVDQLDLDELSAGTEQVFSQRYKQRLIDQEVDLLIEEFKGRTDVDLGGDERAEFTQRWIEKRAEELAKYQPETFEYSSHERVIKKIPEYLKYSRDPKRAALLMAREQAQKIQAEVQNGPLDVEAMDRKQGIEDAVKEDDSLRAIAEKARRVIDDKGEIVVGEAGSFGYQKTTYEPGLNKEAIDYKSVKGVNKHDRSTNNHYFVDKDGKVVRVRRTPNEGWPGGTRSKIVERHTFSEKNRTRAQDLVRKLADKQGAREAKSETTDMSRHRNVRLAEERLKEVDSKRRSMAEEARERSRAQQEE
jgi:hypothetical protein